MPRPLHALVAIMLLMPASAGVPAAGGTDGGRAAPSADFTNVTVSAGLANVYGDSYAWGDYDGDGYEDLLVKGARLFRNNGPPDWNFTETTAQAGLNASGYAVWGDYNRDGYPDFFVAGNPEGMPDTLWRNNGPPDWNFTNATIEAGNIDDGAPSLAPAWGDYDRDGYLDVYVMNWRDAANIRYPDKLWHNNGNGTFTDATTGAGIVDNPPNAGMGAMWGDYNNDGWPDAYAGNYLLGPNYLWTNNHNSTFTDLALELGAAGDPDYYRDGTGPYYGHTAGSAFGDYNNDGNLDIWVGNLAHKDPDRAPICDDAQLLRNNGGWRYDFTDVRNQTGIPVIPANTVVGGQYRDEDFFGGAWGDYDNDGLLDLYVPEVKTYHPWAYSHLFHNNGDTTFTDVINDSGMKVWSNVGGAWADYDNDGDLDLVTEGTSGYQGPWGAHLFRNDNANGNHWLAVRLKGVESNPSAIGARVKVTSGNLTMIREIEGGTGGHAYQNSLRAQFGLGDRAGPVTVEIRWPGGRVQVAAGVAVDRLINITEEVSGPEITTVPTPAAVSEDDTVTFTATVQGSAASYSWDFDGDGVFDWNSSSNQAVARSYPLNGTYHPALKVMDGAGRLGSYESTILWVRNRPPAAGLGPNITAFEDDVVVLNATGTLDTPSDRANLTYNFTFGDGNWTGWQSWPLANRTYPVKGLYRPTVTARDDDGATGMATTNLTVLNAVPSVTISANPTAAEDSVVALNATGRDTPSDAAGLQYRWNPGEGSMTSWSYNPRITHLYAKSGIYTVRAEIRDGDGAVNSSSMNLTIYDVPPTASPEWRSKSAGEDETIHFSGGGSDTPSDIAAGLEFMWDFGDGNTTDWMLSAEADHGYARSGNYTARLLVRDDDGVTSNASVNVAVRNIAPKAEITRVPDEMAEDDSETFTGAGTDTPSDRPSLRYMWDFGDGNASAWSASPDATHAYPASGDYTVTLSVRDDDGAVASATATVPVLNAPPSAAIAGPKASVFNEDEVVRFAGEGLDTPSDTASLRYSWEIAGMTFAGREADHSFTRAGAYTVTLIVSDNDGAAATVPKKITVKNLPPLAALKASAANASVGEKVAFTATVNDTPSDVPGLKVSVDLGDRTTSTDLSFSHAYTAKGVYTVTLRVTDEDGETATAQVRVTVTAKETGPVERPVASGPSPLIIGGAVAGVAVAVVLALGFLGVIPLFGKRKRKPIRKDRGKEEE